MALFPDIFNAVTAAMPATVVSRFGRVGADIQDAPPRLVWVPTEDSFDPTTGWRGSNLNDPRALHTNVAGLEVHCWGADTPGALALRDTFILALRSTLGPNYRLLSGSWLGQHDAAAGRVYVLSLQILVPITDVPPSLTTSASAPATVTFGPSHPGP